MSWAATTALGVRSATSAAGTAAASIEFPLEFSKTRISDQCCTYGSDEQRGPRIGYRLNGEHAGTRRGGGAGSLLVAVAVARVLRRAGRNAGAGRGGRRDCRLPAGVERQPRRAVRDEAAQRPARRLGAEGCRTVP